MSGYMVYLPGASGNGLDALTAVGLESLADGEGVLSQVGPGPDGKTGLVVSISSGLHEAHLQYREALQEWKDCGKYWLGRDRSLDVNPEALRRRQLPFRCHAANLADGQDWEVPVISTIPRKWGLGPDGEFQRKPPTRYEELCNEAELVYEYFRSFSTDPNRVVDYKRCWHFGWRAIEAVYRVNEAFVNWLELVDDHAFMEICTATLQMRLIEEVEREKKTTA